MTKPISARLCPSVGEASELLKKIANANRLAIVCHLMQHETSVAGLELDLGIQQPTLSQQLAELRAAGIIDLRRDGKSVIYRVVDERIVQLVLTLREFFGDLSDVTGKLAMRNLAPDQMMFD